MKPNYDAEMLKILEANKGKTILLHSCCGPCSSYVIKELANYLKVSVFYYNPNIEPLEEYEKRKKEQIRLIQEYQKEGMPVEFLDYEKNDTPLFLEAVKGLEQEKEGGARCPKCFYLRLKKTAEYAKIYSFDFFGTTLTVSPHKNAEQINKIGLQLEKEIGVSFLVSDFKKREGYKKSIEYSKKWNLYRQNYCGCSFSFRRNQNEL
jgi:predicted adenine nucleotide alpha hydrolase (AANH) superfamily ATPase